MNKLVYGVGVNDLDYKVRVMEDVTKDGGRRGKIGRASCRERVLRLV